MGKIEEIINLTDKQRRDILDIYIAGRRKNDSSETIKSRIADRLNAFVPNYTQSDLEAIFYDCKMYAIIDNMPPEITNKRKEKDRKNARSIPIDRKRLREVAKDYIIKRYSKTDIQKLREDGVIDKIIKEFMRKSKEELLSDFDLKRDMLTFMQDQTKRGEIEEAQLGQIIDDKRIFAMFLKVYVENLIAMEERDSIAREDTSFQEDLSDNSSSRSEEDRKMLQASLDHRAEILKARQGIRRKYFVSDTEVERFIESGDYKIALAREYLYNEDGETIRIKNSLVQDKLLTTYLELGRLDEFEKLAKKEMLEYDEETGKVGRPDERTASKYVTFLADKKGDPKQAVDFIEANIDSFSDSIVILSQYYYNARKLSLDNWEEKAIEIADIIIGNAKVDMQRRRLTFENMKFGRITSRSLSFINHLINELIRIKKSPEFAKKGKERKSITDKIGILLTLKKELMESENMVRYDNRRNQSTSGHQNPYDSDDDTYPGRG